MDLAILGIIGDGERLRLKLPPGHVPAEPLLGSPSFLHSAITSFVPRSFQLLNSLDTSQTETGILDYAQLIYVL